MSKIPEGVRAHQELTVVARSVLLDALEALAGQAGAVTIVGAQAIYLRSVDVELAVASFTSDADLGLDPDQLADDPLLEQAMVDAGFVRAEQNHVGAWLRSAVVGGITVNIPVDLLVPQSFAPGGSRSVTIPPHHKLSARRVPGIEGAMVDHDVMAVTSLEPVADARAIEARVAGPAALFIAKAYKIRDRAGEKGQARLTDKDAADVVRLMMSDVGHPSEVAERIRRLQADPRTVETTNTGLMHLGELFGTRSAQGTTMALAALAPDDSALRVAPTYIRDLKLAMGAAWPSR